MTITLTITAADGATDQIVLDDPVVNSGGGTPLPPVSLFTTQTPAIVNRSDGAAVTYEMGTAFQSSVDGTITGIRFWKGSAEATGHVGNIWSAPGAPLASVTFANETASGWQVQSLATPLAISANATYVASVGTSNTNYCATNSGLSAAISNGPLSTVVGNNGLYGARGACPTSSHVATNYFRDVVFVPGGTPPPVTAVPVVSNGNFTLQLPAASGAAVGAMSATNSPTAWSITAGDAKGYFAIDNSGNIRVSAAGSSGLAAGNFSLTCSATNSVGNGSGTAAVTVNAASSTSTWPDATTTGVPAGTVLKASGAVTLNTPGQKIDSLKITGGVTVTAPNCQITRCYIDGGTNNYYAVNANNNTSGGLVISDCEIMSSWAATGAANAYGIICQNAQILRCNIHHCYHALNTNGGNLVQDCVLGPQFGTPAGHYENIFNGGGTVAPDTYRHNTMYSLNTANVFLQTTYGPVTGITIDNNLLLQQTVWPPGYTGQKGTSYNIYITGDGNVITNNQFQKGAFGYYINTSVTNLTWSNNTVYGTGAVINNTGTGAG